MPSFAKRPRRGLGTATAAIGDLPHRGDIAPECYNTRGGSLDITYVHCRQFVETFWVQDTEGGTEHYCCCVVSMKLVRKTAMFIGQTPHLRESSHARLVTIADDLQPYLVQAKQPQGKAREESRGDNEHRNPNQV